MSSGEAALVVFPPAHVVRSDVLLLLSRRSKALEGLDDLVVSTVRAHGLGREVGVAAGAVPVTGDGLGVPGDNDSELLAHAEEYVAGHPYVVSGVDSCAGTDLVLPLSGHDLAVNSCDGNAGEHAGGVVSLDDRASEGVLCSYGAVVRSLRSGHATLRPSEGGLGVGLEEGVLLLDSEPGLGLLDLVKDVSGSGPGVGGDRGA